MTSDVTPPEPSVDEAHRAEPDVEVTPELEDELLVEEISIDGMCGVY